ncbi:MAG: methyltransferase domain-containing protein [Acidobacteria bacterium]|nr:methyltransferase domain-containing protein [Acidobacteriota bacterium]
MSTAHHNPAIGERLRILREQIRKRLERPVPTVPQQHLPPLEPLRAAQTAARNLAGQIGTVNPRPPGLVNRLIQLFKQLISRCMDWYVRPQRDFNRNVSETLQMVSQILETTYQDLNALAQALDQSQQQFQEQFQRLHQELYSEMDRLEARWETRLDTLQKQFEEATKLQQWRSEGVLMRQSEEMQERLKERIQGETAKLREQIETSLAQMQEEFRLLRQRVAARSLTESTPAPTTGIHFPKEAAKTPAPAMDYFQWERHFRGTEEEIRVRQSFYVPFFRGCKSVLDLACGRGEFLELMRQENVPARGVDLNADMVGRCLQKNLDVVQSDVFQYLETVPEASLDGIFCAQFVEHLEPGDYMRLVSEAAAKLGPGGVLAMETQNPECLAIFSQSFFLDPTHVRPIPPAQMRLVFAEMGLERITTHFLSPASAHLPVLPTLNSHVVEAESLKKYNEAVARFNETFFGGMDYAVIGRHPNSLAG